MTLLRPCAPDQVAERWACEYGPLATCRKRVAVACRCAASSLRMGSDRRLRQLLEAGREYACRAAPRAALESALRAAERAAAEAVAAARADVWGIFEGRRAADAAAQARATRGVTAAICWALGMGGVAPTIPASWGRLSGPPADLSEAPVCEPAWKTPDVLALARVIQAGGTDALPILADALQDAGCDDHRILSHCRDDTRHCPACWVPNLLLDTE